MTAVKLDAQLARDCFTLMETDFAWILLLNNAALPWFIVVPKVTAIELCDFDQEQQQQLFTLSNKVSCFIRANYQIDKLNVAGIGNVVKQFHWHVIGRTQDDYCWPDTAWGRPAPRHYNDSEVSEIRAKFLAYLD